MYEYKCVIKRIVDGDTVDIDIDLGFDVWLSDQRVRLRGIDAPENRTRDLVEKHFGNLATAFVEQHLPVNAKAVLVSDKYSPDKGKFGRILGDFQVYDDQTDSWTTLGQLMIREGHAVVYREGAERDLMEQDHVNNRRRLILEGKSTMTLIEAGIEP
jgi:micrococcal nuclease